MKIYNTSWNSKSKQATTKNEEKDELVQGEKKHFDTLFSNIISSSFLACFEQFKKL
jgi:hypothetical protein